jgi:hypothetical protein
MGTQGEVGGPLFASEEELITELAEMSAENAPRRFTLCAVTPDWDDAVVVCWAWPLTVRSSPTCHPMVRPAARVCCG